MIFDRLGILRTFTRTPAAAAALGARWSKAAAREPELAEDLIRIGGVLEMTPDLFVAGEGQNAPLDPVRLAYLAGRRDMALRLLALMGMGTRQINSLMENDDD